MTTKEEHISEEAKQRAKNYMSLKGALEPKQIKCYCGHTITCDCEPLQETLEEANWKVIGTKNDTFYNGAKWQQERMYSEEDMAEAFIACWKANVPDGIECKVSFNKWFEQFKKK